MIEEISIAKTSSFGDVPELLAGLQKCNYIFGSNGTGKTTISRVIADEGNFQDCKVKWSGGTKLQPMVYNRDFVERNFTQLKDLKGVFTLGEKQADTLANITTAKAELDATTLAIETLTQGLQGADGSGGKKAELNALDEWCKTKCWAQKQKHDVNLQGAFVGVRNSAEKFRDKVLAESSSNVAAVLTLSELETKAKTVFGPSPTKESSIPDFDATPLIAAEGHAILKKRVIGKEDVDIAAMIKKLGNSDWVREGKSFYEANGGVCPFCQQETSADFARHLREYFDEAFIADSKAIDTLAANYSTEAARLQQGLAATIASPSKYLDIESLKREKEILDAKVTVNLQRITEKRKEPSRSIDLESVGNVAGAIKFLIDNANGHVSQHNATVANLDNERKTLTAQVWRFVLEELKDDLTKYKGDRANLEKAIAAMESKLVDLGKKKAAKASEIRGLEKQTTSVQPTIDAVNGLLSSFGFRGFSLSLAADGKSYKLVRPNGADAKATLSEGEKTFITFLYFYHLLKGSDTDTGMTADRVVVFDDPVSSLDSDILFIVGSLIKGLFDEVRAGTGHIKQVIVLTHNVYFHKEVTFHPNRRDVAMADETFWMVRKPGDASKVEKCPSNPIKTSYELLWHEVRKPAPLNLTIQNTLRRILENYFKILGGVDPDAICAMFDGKDKLICKSLFSWVNDGSHHAHDDLYVSIDQPMVDKYLGVFREVFVRTKHLEHYKMMMGDAYIEPQPAPAAA